MHTSTSSRETNHQLGHRLGRILTTASAAALVFYGIRRRDLPGAVVAVAGVGLAARGPLKRASQRAKELSNEPTSIKAAITVHSSLTEVFDLLRSPEGLFDCVETIERREDGSTRWTVRLKGIRMHADARIESEQRPRGLRFRLEESGLLQGEGAVELRPAPGGQGTELRVRIELEPSRAPLRLAAHALRKAAHLALFNELARVRQLAETGEIANSAMRLPSGEEPQAAGRLRQQGMREREDEAFASGFVDEDLEEGPPIVEVAVVEVIEVEIER